MVGDKLRGDEEFGWLELTMSVFVFGISISTKKKFKIRNVKKF
jgi:hypothetical protein